MKPKLVVFDLDGTLADTIELIVFALNQALAPVWGAPKSRDDMYALFGPTEEILIEKEAGDRADEVLSHFKRAYATHLTEFVTVFPGILDLLKQLRQDGCALAVLTNKGRWSTDVTLEALRIAPYFARTSTGDDALPKPHPDGIFRLMTLLGYDTSETVLVGDSASDVKAARAAGISVIGAGWGTTYDLSRLEKAKPDALCLQPKEVYGVIEAARKDG